LSALAGDFESVYDHHFEFRRDLPFSRKRLGPAQLLWKKQVVPTLRPFLRVDTFAPTNLSFWQNGKKHSGQVFQGVEDPDLFLLLDQNVLVDFDRHRVYTPVQAMYDLEYPEKKSIVVITWRIKARNDCFEVKVGAKHASWRWMDPSGVSVK
jgi:hypothetical protein